MEREPQRFFISTLDALAHDPWIGGFAAGTHICVRLQFVQESMHMKSVRFLCIYTHRLGS